MEYRELLQRIEAVRALPVSQQHQATWSVWRDVLKAVAAGSWSADVLARVALTLDVTDKPSGNNQT